MGKYQVVLDTETVGGFSKPLVYDFSYCIFNKWTGKTIENHTFIIDEIFSDSALMSTAYFADHVPEILERIELGEFQDVNFLSARQHFIEDCKKYHIKNWFAYNANFDKRSLNCTTDYLTKGRTKYFFPKKFSPHCIWSIAVDAFLCGDDYYTQAIANKWISEKGNVKSSAECAYRYLSGNPNFEERHFGIDDCQIEKEILLYCRSIKGKKNSKPNSAIWRKIQRES